MIEHYMWALWSQQRALMGTVLLLAADCGHCGLLLLLLLLAAGCVVLAASRCMRIAGVELLAVCCWLLALVIVALCQPTKC